MKTFRCIQIVVRSVLSARMRPAFCKGSATVEVVDKGGLARKNRGKFGRRRSRK